MDGNNVMKILFEIDGNVVDMNENVIEIKYYLKDCFKSRLIIKSERNDTVDHIFIEVKCSIKTLLIRTVSVPPKSKSSTLKITKFPQSIFKINNIDSISRPSLYNENACKINICSF